MKKIILFLVIFIMLWGCVNNQNINKPSTSYKQSTNTNNTVSFLKDLTPEQAKKIIEKNQNNPNFVILDVRTKPEFDEKHIKWAIMIDYYSSNFKQQLSKLDKNKTYLIYCRTGHRSWNAKLIMKNLWFKKIYNLLWWINAWEASWLPVVK